MKNMNIWLIDDLKNIIHNIRENEKNNIDASDLKLEWKSFNQNLKKNRSYNSIYALISNLKNLTF